MGNVEFGREDASAVVEPVLPADRKEALEVRFEAAAARLWDARLRYMLMEADRGRSDPIVVECWRRYQALRQECAVLLAEIETLDAED